METTNSEIRHEKDGGDIQESIATQLKGRHTGLCNMDLYIKTISYAYLCRNI